MDIETARAKAVLDGLTNQITCDCGQDHDISIDVDRSQYGGWVRSHHPCRCEKKHHLSRTVHCPCGSQWEYGPKVGWRVVHRKHRTWIKREAAFAARIAELEAQLRG